MYNIIVIMYYNTTKSTINSRTGRISSVLYWVALNTQCLANKTARSEKQWNTLTLTMLRNLTSLDDSTWILIIFSFSQTELINNTIINIRRNEWMELIENWLINGTVTNETLVAISNPNKHWDTITVILLLTLRMKY